MPMTDDTNPTIAASPSTERKTCRRLAPTAGAASEPSSRVRWPTMIEKVFRMVKAPTKSEMKAKTRSAVEKNESTWLIAVVCSSTTVWPVTTSTPGGRTWAISRPTEAVLAPGAVTISMLSNWPTSPMRAWAVGTVNAARVAPARLLAVPNRAMPLMVNVSDPPASRILT